MTRPNELTRCSLRDILSDSRNIESIEGLKKHFGTNSASEVIRRSISQSSLLKRYSNAEGDLLIERDGSRYIIPNRS